MESLYLAYIFPLSSGSINNSVLSAVEHAETEDTSVALKKAGGNGQNSWKNRTNKLQSFSVQSHIVGNRLFSGNLPTCRLWHHQTRLCFIPRSSCGEGHNYSWNYDLAITCWSCPSIEKTLLATFHPKVASIFVAFIFNCKNTPQLQVKTPNWEAVLERHRGYNNVGILGGNK